MLESIVYDIIKEEGREEGREEGKEIAKIEDILSVLETRFGLVPTKIEESVKKIKGTKKQEFLLRNAVLVKDLEEFKEVLKKAEEVD